MPISELMSTDLKTVDIKDPVLKIHELINEHKIHHIPVMQDDQLAGIVTSSDILYFLRDLHPDSRESYINDMRLKNYTAEEIMFGSPTCVSPDTTVEVALKIFSENMFHALPVVVDPNQLVGMFTTHDIIKHLLIK